MSKKELLEKIENLKLEIAELEQITQIGNTQSFETFIKKVKEEMIENVKEENWTELKHKKAEIEKMRSFTTYIEKQTTVIEEKETELEDLQYQLDHYQYSLFEEPDEPVFTGIVINKTQIRTGEVYKVNDKNYLLVTFSSEMPDKFALVTNFLDGERLLQYPANQDLLSNAEYIGNTYYSQDKEASKALKIIQDYFKSVTIAKEKNTVDNGEEGD